MSKQHVKIHYHSNCQACKIATRYEVPSSQWAVEFNFWWLEIGQLHQSATKRTHMSGIIILQKKTSYITTLRKIRKLCAICIVQGCSLGYSLLLKNPSKPTTYNSLVRLARLGPKRAPTATNFPPSLLFEIVLCLINSKLLPIQNQINACL